MKITHWLLILAALIIAYLILTRPEDQSEEVTNLKAKIERRDSAIHDWSRKYVGLRTRMRQDSILFRDTITIKEKEIVSHKSNIKRLRSSPKVIEIVREVPEIDTLLSYYDSAMLAQQLIIYSQEKQINQLYVDINEIERNFEHRLGLQAETIQDQQVIIKKQGKQIKNEKKKTVIGTALGAIGGAIARGFFRR